MVKLLGKCPRCKGNICDDGGEVKCLQCGFEAEDTKKRREWWKANVVDMAHDLFSLGTKGFLEKWGLKHQQISHIKSTDIYKALKQKKPAPAAPRADKPIPIFTITDRDVEILDAGQQLTLWSVLGDISVARIKQTMEEVKA